MKWQPKGKIGKVIANQFTVQNLIKKGVLAGVTVAALTGAGAGVLGGLYLGRRLMTGGTMGMASYEKRSKKRISGVEKAIAKAKGVENLTPDEVEEHMDTLLAWGELNGQQMGDNPLMIQLREERIHHLNEQLPEQQAERADEMSDALADLLQAESDRIVVVREQAAREDERLRLWATTVGAAFGSGLYAEMVRGVVGTAGKLFIGEAQAAEALTDDVASPAATYGKEVRSVGGQLLRSQADAAAELGDHGDIEIRHVAVGDGEAVAMDVDELPGGDTMLGELEPDVPVPEPELDAGVAGPAVTPVEGTPHLPADIAVDEPLVDGGETVMNTPLPPEDLPDSSAAAFLEDDAELDGVAQVDPGEVHDPDLGETGGDDLPDDVPVQPEDEPRTVDRNAPDIRREAVFTQQETINGVDFNITSDAAAQMREMGMDISDDGYLMIGDQRYASFITSSSEDFPHGLGITEQVEFRSDGNSLFMSVIDSDGRVTEYSGTTPQELMSDMHDTYLDELRGIAAAQTERCDQLIAGYRDGTVTVDEMQAELDEAQRIETTALRSGEMDAAYYAQGNIRKLRIEMSGGPSGATEVLFQEGPPGEPPHAVELPEPPHASTLSADMLDQMHAEGGVIDVTGLDGGPDAVVVDGTEVPATDTGPQATGFFEDEADRAIRRARRMPTRDLPTPADIIKAPGEALNRALDIPEYHAKKGIAGWGDEGVHPDEVPLPRESDYLPDYDPSIPRAERVREFAGEQVAGDIERFAERQEAVQAAELAAQAQRDALDIDVELDPAEIAEARAALEDSGTFTSDNVMASFTERGGRIKIEYHGRVPIDDAVDLLGPEHEEIIARNFGIPIEEATGRIQDAHQDIQLLASLREVRDEMMRQGLTGTDEFAAVNRDIDKGVRMLRRYGHIIADDPDYGKVSPGSAAKSALGKFIKVGSGPAPGVR